MAQEQDQHHPPSQERRSSRPTSLPAQFISPALDRLQSLLQSSQDPPSFQDDVALCRRRLLRIAQLYPPFKPVHLAYAELMDYVDAHPKLVSEELVLTVTDILRTLARRKTLLKGDVMEAVAAELTLLLYDITEFLVTMKKQGAFMRKLIFSGRNNKRRTRLRERCEEADVRVRFFVRVRPTSHAYTGTDAAQAAATLERLSEESALTHGQTMPSKTFPRMKAKRDLDILPPVHSKSSLNHGTQSGQVLVTPISSQEHLVRKPSSSPRSPRSPLVQKFTSTGNQGEDAGIAMLMPLHDPCAPSRSRKGSKASNRSNRSNREAEQRKAEKEEMKRMHELGLEKVAGWLASVEPGPAGAVDMAGMISSPTLVESHEEDDAGREDDQLDTVPKTPTTSQLVLHGSNDHLAVT